jgi:hypothetical protein
MTGDRITPHAHAVAVSAEQPMRSAHYVLRDGVTSLIRDEIFRH